MAFGAGVLVAAAFLDLLPSAISAATNAGGPKMLVFLIAALGGLLIFSVGETTSHFSTIRRASRTTGRVNACLLILHSTLDGTAIFAASTISLQMGLIVGLGIVAHDICDGLNTVLLSAGGLKPGPSDYAFLALDAGAPIADGLIAAHLFTVSPAAVMFFLSLAAGSFLFTAFFGLLPGAWRAGRRKVVPLLGIVGFLLVFCLTKLLGALG
jgi:ZIP family zinc transporter